MGLDVHARSVAAAAIDGVTGELVQTRLTPSHEHIQSWLAALSPAASARGDEGNRRLHHRWVVFTERRKRHTVANVAVARELAGWCWSLAVMDDD
ncbi:hypothetical protein ASH01_22295 [Terrabacter sp. Soil811]|nr:hypothetical protein ASH01_22295 [Terrabacter sp. Soil811]